MLLERSTALFPDFDAPGVLDQCQMGVGIRGVPADERSIVGPLPASEGVHIAVTHSGVTLSLVLGRLLADSIEQGGVPDELVPFGVSRFQGF